MSMLSDPLMWVPDSKRHRARRLDDPLAAPVSATMDPSVKAAALRMTTEAGLESTRRELLLRMLGWLLLTFTILLPLVSLRDLSTRPWTLYIHAVAYLALALVWFRRRHVSTATIATVVLGLLYALGTASLLRTGVIGINGLAYGLLVIICPLMFGLRAGIAAALCCCVTYAIVAILANAGVLTYGQGVIDYAVSRTNWVHTGAAFAAFSITAVIVSTFFRHKLHQLLRSEAARSQMLAVANAQLAEANARLRDLNAQLEKRVCERTRSLEEANRELETFSYTVSHDLRSPLQVIEGFSSLALQEEGNAMPVKARDYLHKIQGGARRMHEMIGHLLRFSQLNARVAQRQPINLSERAQHILSDLRVTDPTREVQVIIEPDMVESADPELMDSLLLNLLTNAWKFSARSPVARIEFTRVRRDGQFVYKVSDNGLGFDSTNAKRLFEPFVRLHDKKEFPGSGIGLATARRIVERHEGRLWAESVPGQGAAFYFTLK